MLSPGLPALHSVGETPNLARNVREKCAELLNPLLKAISLMVKWACAGSSSLLLQAVSWHDHSQALKVCASQTNKRWMCAGEIRRAADRLATESPGSCRCCVACCLMRAR